MFLHYKLAIQRLLPCRRARETALDNGQVEPNEKARDDREGTRDQQDGDSKLELSKEHACND